jgi:hypothetical protein
MIKRKSNLQLESQYKEQGECCYYCKDKVPFEYITRDHFNPVSEGNTLVDNKVFACRSCNSIKGNKGIPEFKASIKKRCEKLMNDIRAKEYDLTDDHVRRLRRYGKIIKTINEIVANDYKPQIIFT